MVIKMQDSSTSEENISHSYIGLDFPRDEEIRNAAERDNAEVDDK